MSEAKETPDDPGYEPPGCELWAGPRAVLAPLQLGPNPQALPPSYDEIIEAGFDGVAWDLREVPGAAIEVLAAIAALLGGVVSRPCAVVCRCDATSVGEAVDEITAVIEACARLGAICLSLTLPPIIGVAGCDDAAGSRTGFRSYQEHLNFTGALLHEARLEAGSAGLALAIEPAVGGGLLSPVELRELIDGAYAASVGVCLDVARLGQWGSAADWIETLCHRVCLVRLPFDMMTPEDVDTIFAALIRFRYDRTIICPDAGLIVRCREAMPKPS